MSKKAEAGGSKLAIDGGSPVRSAPMPARNLFGEEEKAAAVRLFDECIRTGNVFGYNGPEELAFEGEFVAAMGGGFADGVNSGSSAVFAALGALQLEAGSEVIIPPITDPGGAMPVAMLNCVPVPADADPRSYNAGPEQIEAAITPRTRAVIVAHIAGEPADMRGILALARRHGLKVVEDCAQAHGARLDGQLVGTFGDIAAFSTMSGKHFATAAQGGVVYTRSEELHWRGKRFADRGKRFNLPAGTGNVVAGLNLNLNDLSAAIGRVQLAKLPSIVERRRRAGEAVRKGLAKAKAVRVGWVPQGAEPSYWFLRVTIDESKLTVPKLRYVEALVAEGIPASASYGNIPVEQTWYADRKSIWCPWAFRDAPAGPYAMPHAVEAVARNFNISLHEGYGDQEARDMVDALLKVEKAYLKP